MQVVLKVVAYHQCSENICDKHEIMLVEYKNYYNFNHALSGSKYLGTSANVGFKSYCPGPGNLLFSCLSL